MLLAKSPVVDAAIKSQLSVDFIFEVKD